MALGVRRLGQAPSREHGRRQHRIKPQQQNKKYNITTWAPGHLAGEERGGGPTQHTLELLGASTHIKRRDYKDQDAAGTGSTEDAEKDRDGNDNGNGVGEKGSLQRR